jgi:hypothetical protein
MDTKANSSKCLDEKQKVNRKVTISITLDDNSVSHLFEASMKNFYHEQKGRFHRVELDGNCEPSDIEGGYMYFVEQYLSALYVYEYCKSMDSYTCLTHDEAGDYCVISKHQIKG